MEKATNSMRIDLEQIFKKIRPHMDTIIKQYNVDVIGIIGSYLKGEQKTDNDLGFYIKFTSANIKSDHINNLKKFLEDVFNLKIDLLIENQLDEKLKPKIIKDVEFIEG